MGWLDAIPKEGNMRLERPRAKRAGKFALVLDREELMKLFHLSNRTEDKLGIIYFGGQPDGVEQFGEALARTLEGAVL